MSTQSEDEDKLFYDALVRLQISVGIRQNFLNLLTDIKAHTSNPNVIDLIDTLSRSLDQADREQLADKARRRFQAYGYMPPS